MATLNIKEYLDRDEQKDLLRFLTAGSVDDGKSTLIGRLLFDSKKLYEDQLDALERDSKRMGNAGDHIDYALLLDGLKAEREQGITIDVAYRYFSTNNRKFIIADTPGHEQYTRNMITGGSTANLAIILVDARTGVITQTRRHTYLVSLLGIKHVVLAVNKVDQGQSPDIYEFYNLGLGTPFPVSANSKIGFGDLLDEVLVHCNPQDADEKEDERPRVAIIGKPNAGKSSLINKLLGEDRLIVSDIAGTTRDAIDTTVKRNGKEYVFIDTAGLRKKARVKEDIERYSVIRTVAAVERCDVAILVIDAEEGITEQDAKIAGIAHERGKGMIIAVNKWDLIEKNDKTIYKFTNQVREVLSYMSYAELVFISAKTGQRLPKIFDVLDMVIENHALRVQTGVLNEILTEAVAMKQPPSDKGKRLKLYYITQVSVKPPTFVVFINDRQLMHFSYTRYLENQIRNTFGFRGTPIHIIARERKER